MNKEDSVEAHIVARRKRMEVQRLLEAKSSKRRKYRDGSSVTRKSTGGHLLRLHESTDNDDTSKVTEMIVGEDSPRNEAPSRTATPWSKPNHDRRTLAQQILLPPVNENTTGSRESSSIRAGISLNKKLTFEQRVEELKEFKRLHGHCKVPQVYKQNPSLGRWYKNMRQGYKALKRGDGDRRGMTEERVKILEAIGFQWRSDKVTKDFEQRVEDLKEFKRQHGHCKVPHLYKQNPSLNSWCNNMKQGYKALTRGNGNRRGMTQERAKTLESIGFDWGSDKDGTDFKLYAEELKAFKRQHGHCYVSQT